MRERAQARAQIGRERAREALQRCLLRDDDLQQRSVEAQRVLERMKPFEHRQLGVAPRAAKARDQRSAARSLSQLACPSGRLPAVPLASHPARSASTDFAAL